MHCERVDVNLCKIFLYTILLHCTFTRLKRLFLALNVNHTKRATTHFPPFMLWALPWPLPSL